jgi:hypothetical protein
MVYGIYYTTIIYTMVLILAIFVPRGRYNGVQGPRVRKIAVLPTPRYEQWFFPRGLEKHKSADGIFNCVQSAMFRCHPKPLQPPLLYSFEQITFLRNQKNLAAVFCFLHFLYFSHIPCTLRLISEDFSFSL